MSLEDRRLLAVSLSALGPPTSLVGSPVTWTASTDDHGQSPVYQFSVGTDGGSLHVVRDFSSGNSFTWDPMQEGNYIIQVIVKDSFSDTSGETAAASYSAESRVTGADAVVSPTTNPLVALYSAPPSSASSMYVQFKPQGSDEPWSSTPQQTVVPGESTNFLVADMRPDTTYLMRQVLNDGTTSAPLTFHTGSLPTNVNFPTFDVPQPPTPGTDANQNIVFHMGVLPPAGTVNTLATDMTGNIVWYYDPVQHAFPSLATSVLPGGSVLLLGGKQDGAGGADSLREVDLAGNTLLETNIHAVNAQLAALGQHAITDFNHDIQRLPNGDIAVLATTPRTIDVNGTPTDYEGEMVIVLDQNLQVAWTWDPFNWLDTNRLPSLNEGPLDWLHSNAIAWSPADGNLLVSMRSQDWILKIDYDNGSGDGHIIWRLGMDGDFSINSSDPSPWFSHQHDARYVNDSTIVLFDDGNVRQSQDPQAHSRGQELVLDEQTMQATLIVNADLGNYDTALGSAQRLPNGNLDFGSGIARQTIEVAPDGSKTFVMNMNMQGYQYRTYIYDSLYGDSANLVDPGFEDPSRQIRSSADESNPQGSAWSFTGPAGVSANGGTLTDGNPGAPQGSQVAYLQQTGSISQSVNFPFAGSYSISLSAARAANQGDGNQSVQVLVDGSVVAVFAPSGSGYTPYSTGPFHVSAGNHTITFSGVDSTGSGATALLDQVRIHNVSPVEPTTPGFVNLSSSFNRIGIVSDGTAFTLGGLDGDGYALSSSSTGPTLAVGDSSYTLGPAGAPDVVSASGQTILLPQGKNGSLNLLATAVNGAQTNQTFLVTYTDGTTATFTQSLSDWAVPTGFNGETQALSTTYRITSDGGQNPGGFHIYQYTFALDPSKEVRSLTLPVNPNVEIFAASLTPADSTPPTSPTSPPPSTSPTSPPPSTDPSTPPPPTDSSSPPPTQPLPPVPPRIAMRRRFLERLTEIRLRRQARLQEFRLRRQARLQEFLRRQSAPSLSPQAGPAFPRLQVQGRPPLPNAALAFNLLHRRHR